MMIYVNVKPGSKRELFEKVSENEYNIWLKVKAEKGKANKELIKILGKEFNVSFEKIKIKNPTCRKKIVEIKL